MSRHTDTEHMSNSLRAVEWAPILRQPGSKISPVSWVSCGLHAISKASQFFDHLGGARCSGLLTHRRAVFLIAHALMQNLPNEAAQTMSNCPDSLLEAETRQQTAKHDL